MPKGGGWLNCFPNMLSNEMESCGCVSLGIRYAAFSSICYRGYPPSAFIVKPIAFSNFSWHAHLARGLTGATPVPRFQIEPNAWFGQSLTVARHALYHRQAQSTATLFTCKSTLSAETGGQVRD